MMLQAVRDSILDSIATGAPPRPRGQAIRVLDLCSGLNGWTAAWRERKHECWGVELDAKFRPELNMDVRHLAKAPHALLDILVSPGWRPDVILASPECKGFSIASVGKMWDLLPDGSYKEKHPTSIYGRSVLQGCLKVIHELQPAYWWLENPRGMMRKMPEMQAYRRVTVSYCSYGEERMKPTDLWGRWPETWAPRPFCDADAATTGLCLVRRTGSVEPLPLGSKVHAEKGDIIVTLPDGRAFKPSCRVFVMRADGTPCHEASPRGARTGTQGIRDEEDRSVVAFGLSMDTCLNSEAAFWGGKEKKLQLDFVRAVHTPGGKAA